MSLAARSLPGHMRWLITAAAGLYTLVSIGSLLGRPLGLFDEPLLYVGARSMLHGAWPHLDFVSVYPPLYYLPTLWSFLLLGQNAVAARLAQLAAYALLLAGAFWVYRAEGLRGGRLVIVLLSALALSAALPLDPAIFAITPSLLALVFYLRALEHDDGRRRWAMLAGAGLCGGLALVTRLDFGLYALATLSIDQLTWPAREVRSSDGLRAWLARDVAPLALSALLVLLGLALAYAGHVREVWNQTAIGGAAQAFRFVFGEAASAGQGVLAVGAHGWWLPILPLAWLALRTPSARLRLGLWAGALVCACAAWLLAGLWPAGLPLLLLPGLLGSVALAASPPGLPRRERVVLLATALYAHHYLGQPDATHQIAATTPVLLLLPSLFEARDRPLRDRPSLLTIGAFCAALALPSLYAGRPRLAQLGTTLALLRAGGWSSSDAERVAGAGPSAAPLLALYPDADERSVASFVRERSRPEEPVYVGLANPDGPALHDLRLSWLLERPPGSRHLAPLHTAAARASVVNDLQARRVPWVVEWRAAAGGQENTAGGLLRRERDVQQFIEQTYDVVLTQGPFVVRRRP